MSMKPELILTGHDHTYERFTPMTPQGEYDAWGLRRFVVGTGGRNLRDVNDLQLFPLMLSQIDLNNAS
jgi:hypothetical protein